MTENKRYVGNYQGNSLVSISDIKKGESINILQIIDRLNSQEEQIKELKNKLDLLSDAMIKFEQFYYTKIVEPSENYNQKTLSAISNAILCDDLDE